MPEEKFGVVVDEEIVQEVDQLIAECDDIGAVDSEIVEPILTAFVQSAVLNSDLIGLYHGVEGRSRGNRFCPWKSISSTSLNSVGT